MSVVANAREMRYDCPYCKKEKGCCSLFFWAVRLTAEDYQALVERGWCRCGRMVYFPINQKCCCPQHSMRIDATRFRPNRAQKRVRRRVENLQSGKWRPSLNIKSCEGSDSKVKSPQEQISLKSCSPNITPSSSKGLGFNMDASAQRKIPSSTNSPSLKCSSSCQPGRDISGMKPEGKVKLVQ